MAASMSMQRIRVNLEEITCRTALSPKKFWYLVDSKSVSTIEDIAHDVIGKFCYGDRVPYVQIFLNGFILPPWERIEVLRENDEIRFSHCSEPLQDSDKDKKKRKNKSKYVIINDSDNKKLGFDSKKRKADFQLSKETLVKTSNKRHKTNNSSKTQQRKSNNLESKKLQKGVTSPADSETDEDSSESSASDEEDSATKPEIKKKVAFKNSKVTKLATNKNVTKQISLVKKNSNLATKTEIESSDSDSDTESGSESSEEENLKKKTPPSLNKVHDALKTNKVNGNIASTSALSKAGVAGNVVKSNVVTKQKPTQESSESGSSDDSSSESDDDESKNKCENTNKIPIVKNNIDKAAKKSDSDDDSSSGTDSDSSDENTKKPSETSISQDGNVEPSEPAIKPKIFVGAQVGDKKKRKRRGRKRCRPKKKKDLQEQNTPKECNNKPWPNTNKSVDYTYVDAADKNIVAVSPFMREIKNQYPAWNKADNVNEQYTFGSGNRGGGFGRNMNNAKDYPVKAEDQDAEEFDGEINERQTGSEYAGAVKDENYSYPANGKQAAYGSTTKSLDLSVDLLGGVQVYSRNKKMQKKRSSFPLSEAMAMSEKMQHKSFTFEDNAGSGDEVVMKPKIGQNSQRSGMMEVENAPPPQPARDYSILQDLHGPPRTGDKIAYKVLEVSESYCPEVSDYKEALVKGYNPTDNTLELEILLAKAKNATGRFDCMVEDEDEILTNTKGEIGTVVMLNWSELMQTKLVV